MTNDEDDVIVTNCSHRKGAGRACAMCLLESVQEFHIEQQRATRDMYHKWVKEQMSTILKPNCERG